MREFGKLTPDELKAMASDIAHISNRYHSTTDEDFKLSVVEFSANKKMGVEAFATDANGKGLLVIKVTLNQARDPVSP